MFSNAMRQRLGAIARERRAASENGSRVHAPDLFDEEPRRHFARAGIEEVLPGGVIEGPAGSLFVHERLYTDLGERPAPLLKKFEKLATPSSLEPRRPRRLTLPEAVAELDPPERGLFRRYGHRKMLFLDIETCGLAPAPVFLVGLAMVSERNFVLRQLFARDYAEEQALLHEIGRLALEHDFLVTFNGKTFDVPFLRDRATHHRIRFALDLPHLDLVWMARRRWKETLPDCRLKTLEWHILRRRRSGDVGGAEIPGLYHDYVRRGEPHRLLPVFHHNLLDVVAMVELIPPLFDPETQVY